jgi:hypothetical protein
VASREDEAQDQGPNQHATRAISKNPTSAVACPCLALALHCVGFLARSFNELTTSSNALNA